LGLGPLLFFLPRPTALSSWAGLWAHATLDPHHRAPSPLSLIAARLRWDWPLPAPIPSPRSSVRSTGRHFLLSPCGAAQCQPPPPPSPFPLYSSVRSRRARLHFAPLFSLSRSILLTLKCARGRPISPQTIWAGFSGRRRTHLAGFHRGRAAVTPSGERRSHAAILPFKLRLTSAP
jgi:hypothetical protein